MALELIKEDGTGLANANSYASVAEADTYGEANPWSNWDMATTEQKIAALVRATVTIDAMYQFNGGKAKAEQALQWPRVRCPDPDAAGWSSVLTWRGWDRCVPDNVVPVAVMRATCEMAKELIQTDRTAAPPGEGIDTVYTSNSTGDMVENSSGASDYRTSQATSTKYSKQDARPIMSRLAQAMLSKYGTMVAGNSSQVRLLRT